jgi:hypothetical protein
MKTKNFLLIIAFFVTFNSFAQELTIRQTLFNKLDHKEINQITVTKSLLNLVPEHLVSGNIKGIKIENFFSKMDQIDIFISQNNNIKKMMQKEISDFMKKNQSYEILMKIKGEGDNIVFYGLKSGEFITSLVMYIEEEGDECILIHLSGKFSTQDIQEMTEKKK